MISEQTALSAATRIETIRSFAAPISRRQLAVAGDILQRAATGLRGWVRIPALPYAALWEASVVAGTLREPKDFEAARSSTETGPIRDSWLRG